ncbi:hypothetical protein K7X08_032489 [Anisodus acutangulus]|uniref:Secreted protein n=1 Tax=Anisodus acutangulus TaxID=402998 RepID=A0A9Q1R4L8_9SOLA|nr:hypothetical protein K7X08_032489 [Anisodus acutangulus]
MRLLVRLFVIDIAASAVPLHSVVEARGLMFEASVAFPFAIDSSGDANPKVVVTVLVVIDSETSFAFVLAATAIVDLDLAADYTSSQRYRAVDFERTVAAGPSNITLRAQLLLMHIMEKKQAGNKKRNLSVSQPKAVSPCEKVESHACKSTRKARCIPASS